MTTISDVYNRSCDKCPLCENEGHICIAGVGNLVNPGIVIVGDAPDKREASSNRAYADQRGELLIEALKEVGIPIGPKGQVYATYATKCFPAGKIKVKDMKVCAENYLMAELDFLKPELILVLGKNAQIATLGNNAAIARTHGKLFTLEREDWSAQVMPVDHPFAVLHNPAKLDQWLADLKRAKVTFFSEGSPYWSEDKLGRFDFRVIESIGHFKEVAKELITKHRGKYLAIDIEASGLDHVMWFDDFKVYSLQFGIVNEDGKPANDTDPVYVLPIQSASWACSRSAIWLDKLVPLLNHFLHPRYFKLVAHNGKYDLKGLRRIGVDKAYLDRDTMVMWAAIHGEAPMSLKEIAYQLTDLGGYEKVMDEHFKEHKTYDAPAELLSVYGALDIVITRHLMYEHLSPSGIMNRTTA